MTKSLLALVASRAPNPVPVDVALEAVWPGVDPAKSRARLRTAASQIRKAVGANILHRSGESLVLHHCWVDTGAFETAAADVRRLLIMDEIRAGIARWREAAWLISGDLCDDLPYADWVTDRRKHFSDLHRALLVETSEAAVRVKAWDDAVELAERAALMDRADERACRVLMRAHEQLGETEQALLAFERCRHALVETLGADPSEQTLAIHRTLLRREAARPPLPFIGRADLTTAVLEHIGEGFRSRRARIIHLTGPTGAGKSRLMDELALQTPERVVLLRLQSIQGMEPGTAYTYITDRTAFLGPDVTERARSELADTATLVCIDDAQWADPQSLDHLHAEVEGLEAPLVIVMAGTDAGWTQAAGATAIKVGPLRRHAVQDFAQAMSGRQLAIEEVDVLHEASGGLPGPLLDEAWRLRASPPAPSPDSGGQPSPRREGPLVNGPAERVLDAARALLTPAALDLLDVLAVLDQPVEADQLRPLVGEPDVVNPTLDVLADAGVLTRQGTMWMFAHDALQTAAYRWLRPSVRRALHHRLARDQQVSLSRDTRLNHWLASGTPHRSIVPPEVFQGDPPSGASALRISGPLHALLDGEDAAARMTALVSLIENAEDFDQATTARLLEHGIDIAQRHGTGVHAKMLRLRASLRLPDDDAMHWYGRARMHVGAEELAERARIEMVGGQILGRFNMPWAVTAHREAMRLADALGDPALRVEARGHLAAAVLAMRDRAEALQLATDAADIADQSRDDVLRARALMLIATPALYAGDPKTCMHALERAWGLATTTNRVHARVLCMMARALHQAADPSGVEVAMTLARELLANRTDAEWHRTAAEIALDQHDLEATRAQLTALDAHDPWASAFDYSVGQLLHARLAGASGDRDEALAAFRRVILVADHSGATLLLPQAKARLATMLAGDDIAASEALLRDAVMAIGGQPFPRERTIILGCRAEVLLGSGQRAAAVGFARAALATASQAGLVRRAREAERLLTRCEQAPPDAAPVDIPAFAIV